MTKVRDQVNVCYRHNIMAWHMEACRMLYPTNVANTVSIYITHIFDLFVTNPEVYAPKVIGKHKYLKYLNDSRKRLKTDYCN